VGTRSAETVREIEETRERMQGKIMALEDRMPQPAMWMKRIAGIAVGGGAGGTMFWFAVKRVRARKRRKEEAQMPMKAVVNLVPERWQEKIEDAMADENAKQLALGAFAVWVLLKLAEMRQMRAMRRAMMATR
jgi:hypothetical protein